MNVGNSSVDTELKFDLFWEFLKAFPPSEPNPNTGMHYEIINRNNVEMLKIRRKKNIFVDEYTTKYTARNRFYALVSGYYPNGNKATPENIRNMSVFVSVYKQFNKHINSKPINSIQDIFKIALVANKFVKLN